MTLVLVFLLLLFVTAGIMILSAYALNIITSDTHKLLWRAYLTEIMIISFLLVPAYLGGWFFLITLILLSLRGYWELFKCSRNLYVYYFLTSFIISLVLLFLFYFLAIPLLNILFVHLLMASLAALVFYLKKMPLQQTNGIMFVLNLSIVCLLGIGMDNNGFILIFFLFVITECNDSFAYLVGKLIGKHKMLPAISPNKTIEGLLGGILFSFLTGFLLNSYTLNLPDADLLLLLSVCITCTICGDLVFSIYKRGLGIKDFPVIIQHQGGALDIYDSVLFTSIFYFLLLKFMY